MTYLAAEPDQVAAYLDQGGNFHASRDDAIEANFKSDFHLACVDILENHDPRKRFAAMPVLVMADFVRAFIEHHPDMVRVVLGDRHATG